MRVAPAPDLLTITVEDLGLLSDEEFIAVWQVLGVIARRSALVQHARSAS